MSLGPEQRILAALGLDLLLGDPRWLPHPVKLIGRLAQALEGPARRLAPRHPRAAGAATALFVVAAAGGTAWAAVWGAGLLHPLAGQAVEVLLLYTAFAARDLADHARQAHRALAAGDLPEARRLAARLVGRDTALLDEEGLARAVAESVAENTVDGVAAPLFFAVLGGAPAALAYKAASTLDSTFGYRDERYLFFGWASARLDDLANWLPARLAAPLFAPAALLLGLRPWNCLKVMWRDARKHESPNAGWSEAAAAGALGVRLGGPSSYGGEIIEKPLLGGEGRPARAADIVRATALMLLVTLLAAGLFLGARLAALAWLGKGAA